VSPEQFAALIVSVGNGCLLEVYGANIGRRTALALRLPAVNVQLRWRMQVRLIHEAE
jgi:hypothetical protein